MSLVYDQYTKAPPAFKRDRAAEPPRSATGVPGGPGMSPGRGEWVVVKEIGMNRFKSWMLGLLALGGTVAAVVAPMVDARTLDEIMASKKLIVGINPPLPPLGIFNDKNQIDGFDADIA